METMDIIMAFKDHFAFKFVHGSQTPRQSKDEMIIKMSIDLPNSGVEFVGGHGEFLNHV